MSSTTENAGTTDNAGTTASGAVAAMKSLLSETSTPEDLLAALQQTLTERQDYHRLFDAKLIAVRRRLGLPLSRPTSLDNVPKAHEQEFREAYISAAREIGHLFLQAGRLSDAWAYYRTIGEPEPVRAAIEKITVPREPDETFEEIMNVALYEGAHICRGLEFLLKTHGTCNTVTAFSQLQQQMTAAERRRSAAMMVRTIHDDVLASVRRHIENRMPLLSPATSLTELISDRDWLFDEGNYHIDVSHLHSTVAFARALHAEDPELRKAVELCDYGIRLAPHLQYPGDVPFDEYYTANRFFLKALAGDSPKASLDYFRDRLSREPDLPDQRLIAFVLLDLAERLGRLNDVIDDVTPFVSRMEDPNGFSFTEMCLERGMADRLERSAEENDDVLAYALAGLSRSTPGSP
ncbi:MAG: hypothetical protein KDA89_11230 [Planctomycetaceae bacterium]|nr:hypothetical protein [Planctomycetaceae bacterium]